jgi:transcriptional regulator with XRE-family HTH domain
MNNLKKTMKIRSITQAELARQLKVTKQCVNNWTRGINYPDYKNMKKVAEYLQVPIGKLFFEEDIK